MKKIIIIGGGGHARVLKDILDLFPEEIEIIGFTDLDDNSNLDEKYLGDDSAVEQYRKEDVFLVNGIGSVRQPILRKNKYEELKKKGYRFHAVIHPQAVISKRATLAEDVQIMANAVVNTGAQIAENVIINTSATIEHDCIIAKHTHIAPGATLSGAVSIGECCLVGTGAVIIQGITVGHNALIGARALAFEPVSDNEIILGNKGVMHDSQKVQ